MSDKNTLRYIAYVRKSAEDKEKQELSHLSQIENIKEKFGHLNIVKWMPPESQSAFTQGRPIFQEMMRMLENGEADGIVAWHPNRLSRNEVDSGQITYALRSYLKDLKFCSYNFDNNPEGIMFLQFTMNQGQYQSAKQGVDVSRGLKTKAGTGEKPGRVMPGYIKAPVLDDYGQPIYRDKKIITHTVKDPERYDIIRSMWDWFLYDRLTPRQIWLKVNSGTTYKTPLYKRRKDGKPMGGKPMPQSLVYRVLSSDFYIGNFYHLGKLYTGKYPKMITTEEYQLAQELLGAKGNKRLGGYEYAYAGMMKCGECGCTIQARHNTKYIKSKNKHVTYVYYYCSRKSMYRKCTQTKYTHAEAIENDIETELAKYTIIPEFKDIALKILKRNHKVEATDRKKIYTNLQTQRNELQDEIDKLLTWLHKELIDEEEYKRHRDKLKAEMYVVDEKLRGTEDRAENSTEMHEKAFSFAVNAKKSFAVGDVVTKRGILLTLGQTLTLKDNKLFIEPNEWLVPINADYSELEKHYLYVRTNKKATTKELEAALLPIYETWRAQRGSNSRHAA